MKGLLYKDFWLSKKYYSMAFVFFFVFGLLTIMVRLSMIFGNLSHNEEVVSSLLKSLWVLRYTPCAILMIAFADDGGVVFSDYQSGWIRFCATTELGEYKMAGAKLASRLIMMVIAYVISFAYLTLFTILSGDSLSWENICDITILFLMISAGSVLYLTMGIVLKKQQAVEIAAVGFFCILGIIITFPLMMSLDDVSDDFDLLQVIGSQYESVKSMLLPISIICILATGIIYWYVSINVFKRRDS